MARTVKINIDKHMAIIGETGEGKTPIANDLYKNTVCVQGVPAHSLYVDFEDVGEIDSVVEVNLKTDDLDLIKQAFAQGKRVSVIPSEDKERRIKEIQALWKYLQTLNLVIAVFADEIQEYGNEDANPFNKFAVRGQKYGIHLVAITQRVAKLPTTIATQSNVILHFGVSNMEKKYYKDRNLPAEEIIGRVNPAPKHSFVIYRRGSGVSQPFKLNI